MPAQFVEITSEQQLDAVFAESFTRPVALVKHSNSCGISSHILEQLGEIDGDLNIIVVQNSRALSDLVVERVGHRHHSPQAFVLIDGHAAYHATHYGIDPVEMAKTLVNRKN